MKFPNVNAQVPKDEHFDDSAVNEGIWLSEGHLTNVENALVAAAANNIAQETRIQELTGQLATANASLTEAQSSLTTANGTISSLQTEVQKLKAAPAGALQQPVKEGSDETPGSKKELSATTKEANRLRVLSGLKPIE